MEIMKMNYKNGNFEISVDHAGKLKLIADKSYDIIKSCGNFIEIHMKHDESGEEFVFSMQKKKGVTPAQYRILLENEILILKELLRRQKNE